MSSTALKATRDKSAFPGKQYSDAEVLKENPKKQQQNERQLVKIKCHPDFHQVAFAVAILYQVKNPN